ncbi:MAG: nitrogen fixation protein FixH [Gammaproteobacteria bacterium]|uniref:nitrogen fixation protein FixH n=1 Tax=Azohydromonas sp. TaxID=1872666 RepID=UPI002C08D76A|nr:nitrogen fixation protein FixH [Azohydromonas sp.]HMM87325.1 nitrogen fixation protein FixH [Azohydromonas sp.]
MATIHEENRMRHKDAAPKPTPWWRVGMVWLVIGGPLTVVVAGIVTAVIAVRGADPVLDTSARRASMAPTATSPAVQARNHAATPPSR